MVTRWLPSVAVTLVFTDISGSTAPLHDTNGGYAALLANVAPDPRRTSPHEGLLQWSGGRPLRGSLGSAFAGFDLRAIRAC